MGTFYETPLGPASVRITRSAGPAAPPWVLLHGAAGSWRTFRALQAADGFPDDVDTVVIDLPGWGDSPGAGAFTIGQQAAAVVGILGQAGYGQWRIFGHSMGGVLALEIAAVEPERTLSAVVLSPTALTASRALRRPVGSSVAMAPLIGMHLIMRFLDRAGALGPKLVGVALRTGVFKLLLRPFFVRPSALPPEVVGDLAADARPGAFLVAARALQRYDFTHWGSIAGSPLLLRGSRDIFTPDTELRELARLIPGARVGTLAQTGHFAHIEDARGTARLLAEETQRRAVRAATPDAPDP